MVNYFLVATALLAIAYVSAINGKHYSIAAVLALSGMALTTATFLVGLRQRGVAYSAGQVLIELQGRVDRRLKTESIRPARAQPADRLGQIAVPVMFGLVLVLEVSALLYAVFH